MTTHEVHATSGAYRAAVAEIAPRARLGGGPGAVHVIDGRGVWWERVTDTSGAAGFVIDEPRPAPGAAHALLRGIRVPVVVARRCVRSDVAADAGTSGIPPHHVVVDAWGGRTDAASLLRDAVAWARVLAGGPLRVDHRVETARATMLSLTGPGGVGVSVTRAVGGGVGGALTALALGPSRVEVRVDSATARPEVTRDGEAGRLVSPARHESPERLALRRLLDAVDARALVADLDELRADDEMAGSDG